MEIHLPVWFSLRTLSLIIPIIQCISSVSRSCAYKELMIMLKKRAAKMQPTLGVYVMKCLINPLWCEKRPTDACGEIKRHDTVAEHSKVTVASNVTPAIFQIEELPYVLHFNSSSRLKYRAQFSQSPLLFQFSNIFTEYTTCQAVSIQILYATL